MENNLYSELKTGLKWSIPYIAGGIISALNPQYRDVWLKYYLLFNSLSLEKITVEIVILISAVVLIGTFLEELMFRGMIQQYIKKFTTPRISVLITAGIFAIAHCGHFFSLSVSLDDVVALFVLGILTGFAFNKYNFRISSFIPHLVFNLKFIIFVPVMLI